jgi:hypothetical protein
MLLQCEQTATTTVNGPLALKRTTKVTSHPSSATQTKGQKGIANNFLKATLWNWTENSCETIHENYPR